MAKGKGANKRSKAYGYEVERYFLDRLKTLFPGLKRVGSMGYSKSHADLVQDGFDDVTKFRIVATKDKRRDALVTLSLKDFLDITEGHALWGHPVVVQVKGRKTSTLGTLYQDLKKATR